MYVKGRMFVPCCTGLQLDWFVVTLSVELRNLHHPRYLDSHHWVIYFIWDHKQTHVMNGQRIGMACTLKLNMYFVCENVEKHKTTVLG